VREPLRKRNK